MKKLSRLGIQILIALIIVQFGNAQISVMGGNGLYATYTSLTNGDGLFSSLNLTNQTGRNIVVTISQDIINEPGTTSLTGAGGMWTSLTIKPVGNRTISGSVAGHLIDLEGADYVTIDGLNDGTNSLTISNTYSESTTETSTIRFINSATNNIITNCTILGSYSPTAVTTAGGTIFFSTGAAGTAGNDNNTISFCNIGPAGVNLPLKAIFGNGSTTNGNIRNSGIIIDNNNIYDYFKGSSSISAGIYINNGCNSWTISDNKFYQTDLRTWTASQIHRPISINGTIANQGAESFTITGNIIGYSTSSQTGVYSLTGSNGKFNGIHFNGISGGATSFISNNTIASVSLSGVSTNGTGNSSPFMGIYITNGNINSNSNIIGSMTSTGSLIFSTSSTGSTDVYGLLNLGSDSWTANNNQIGGISVSKSNSSGSDAVLLCGIRAGMENNDIFTCSNNLIGGTVDNSIQLTAGSTSSRLIGILTNSTSGALGPASSISLNTIRNLTIDNGTGTAANASVTGICINSTDANHTVSENTIYSLKNSNSSISASVNGICYTASTGANIVERNVVRSLSASSASSILNVIYVIGGTATYQNNMISLGIAENGASLTTALNINGINETNGSNNFYFNTINITGVGIGTSANNTYALLSSITNNNRNYKNNIFYNTRSNATTGGTHYSCSVGGSEINPTGLTMNYNDYYVSGLFLARYNSGNVANLSDWQTVVGQDANSTSTGVTFVSSTDLHLSGSSKGDQNLIGTPIDGITNDFDNDARNASYPYMGADEDTDAPLPIQLSSFIFRVNNRNVVLSWITTSEINNAGFEVQRSVINEQLSVYNRIGYVKGMGTKNSPTRYEFEDRKMEAGKYRYRLKQIDFNGNFEYFYMAGDVEVGVPVKYRLGQNYPNPFNPSTKVDFDLPVDARVMLVVYDVTGREVSRLINNEFRKAGYYTAEFDAGSLSSGVYFYRLSAEGFVQARRMVLLR